MTEGHHIYNTGTMTTASGGSDERHRFGKYIGAATSWSGYVFRRIRRRRRRKKEVEEEEDNSKLRLVIYETYIQVYFAICIHARVCVVCRYARSCPRL